MRYVLAILPLALGCSSLSWAEGEKQDKAYVILKATDLEFRSVHGSKKGNTPGAEFVLGSYITDYVRVEGRVGAGLSEDAPEPGIEIELKGYASWYMGPQYPLTEYLTVYGLFGFSFVQGDTSREDPEGFPDTPDKFYTSSFSASYALGLDYHVHESWYANFEFGRLHRDSQTKVRTMHVGLGVKYEF